MSELTPKQRAFIGWYVIVLNAAEAAKRAGYGDDETDRHTLASIGSENLTKPDIRREIDRLLKEALPSPEEVLQRIAQQAMADIGPYLDEAGQLDVQRLVDDGLGFLIRGITPTREGLKYELTDPQTSQKLLARYYRLLGDSLEVRIEQNTRPSMDELDSLIQQIRSLAQDSDIGVDDSDTDA